MNLHVTSSQFEMIKVKMGKDKMRQRGVKERQCA